MVLDARHRSSIYQKPLPLLGDDDANALMSEFPSDDGDELVTREFLRAELAELRTELFGEIGGLRGEIGWLETRMLVRMGAAMAAQTTVMLTAG